MSELPAHARFHLLFDRFGHRLEELSRRRRDALGIADSVEAVTWNLFRCLESIRPAHWLGLFARRARRPGPRISRSGVEEARISLWEAVAPPPSRQEDLRQRALREKLCPAPGRLRRGRVPPLSELRRRFAAQARSGKALEPPLEIGAVVRTPQRLLYILPVLDGEVEMEVACDRHRNAILRALDAGLHEAGQPGATSRALCVILLYRDEACSPRSVALVRAYRQRSDELARALSHRDRQKAEMGAASLGLLRWRDVGRGLVSALRAARLEPTESCVVTRLLGYLDELGLSHPAADRNLRVRSGRGSLLGSRRSGSR